MTHEFKNLWLGVDISKNSKNIVQDMSEDIKHILEDNSLLCKIPKEHHMTFGYFKHITGQHLTSILSSIDGLKEKHKHTHLINK
jgi:hypothetical protein